MPVPHSSWVDASMVAFSYTVNLALFLLPGIALVTALARRRRLEYIYAVMIIIATGALLGYASFWCFFASKPAAKVFSFAVMAAALFLLVRSATRSAEARLLLRQVSVPFLMVLLAGLTYLSLFFLFDKSRDYSAGFADIRFFEQGRPGDNLIPEIFADKIYDRAPLRPFCCGDWLSSDRPPLQTGIFLLVRPLRLGGSVGLQYQALGTALQCLWICGVWCVLLALGASATRAMQVVSFQILSSFLFYNSVYVWPKLLAAAFLLFVVAILVRLLKQDRPGMSDVVLGATCLGLAMLAHPGSSFSLFAFLLILLAKPRFRRLSQVAVAALVLAMLLLPWMAYQKFVDPPGNRLVKMHLAGVLDIDKRSSWETIRHAYGSRSLDEIVSYKWANVRTLFGSKPLDTFGLSAIRQTTAGLGLSRDGAEESRIVQREYIWNALGWLNIGWIGLMIYLVTRGRQMKPVFPHAGWLLLAGVVNLLLWCLVYFGPGGTFTTHSSYADILLLNLGLCGWLLAMPLPAVYSILALQLFNLIGVWAWWSPGGLVPQVSDAQASFALLAFAGLAICVATFWRCSRKLSKI